MKEWFSCAQQEPYYYEIFWVPTAYGSGFGKTNMIPHCALLSRDLIDVLN